MWTVTVFGEENLRFCVWTGPLGRSSRRLPIWLLLPSLMMHNRDVFDSQLRNYIVSRNNTNGKQPLLTSVTSVSNTSTRAHWLQCRNVTSCWRSWNKNRMLLTLSIVKIMTRVLHTDPLPCSYLQSCASAGKFVRPWWQRRHRVVSINARCLVSVL